MSLYREFETQEQIDAVYNPSATAPDAERRIEGWIERSTAATADLACELEVRFGPTVEEHCDVFPAGAGAPVHLFIHGGYWRRFSARDHAFLARPLVRAGLTTVIMNYALCPKVSLDEIVRQTRAAIAWTYAQAGRFGADPQRLTLSGHSAGAHLAVMALLTDWPGDYGLPRDLIKGVVAISGVYDLGFLPWCYVQPKVQARWGQVDRLSPMRHLPPAAPPLLVAVGDVIGIMGGQLVGVSRLGFNPANYIRNTVDFITAGDVVSGLVKAGAFGFILGLMGCYHGYNSGRGAQGVGRATTDAVVSASVLILAANYLLTEAFF